jgi:molecular chaperone DnaK
MSETNGHTGNGITELGAEGAAASPPIIGIDLGTSTSAIAVFSHGQPKLIADDQGDHIIPSVVQLALGNEIKVGTVAKASAVTFHDRTALEVKRLMGSSQTLKLGPRTFTPVDLSAHILTHLKQAAEAQLGQEVKDIVLSVPARFENAAREDTRRAAEQAGLNVVRLINEPTAAALSYGLDRLEDNQKVLVFDFGGGTLDVTILEMYEGILDVKTSVGDDKLGGGDVDEVIVQIFRDAYKEQHGKKLPAASRDRKAAQMLKEEAERAKIALSAAEEVPVDLPYLSEEGGISLTLTRETLEGHLEEMLMRAMALVNEALSRARLKWADVDVVLPVGGSSRIPLFRRAIEYAWGRPLLEVTDPDEAVAKGAAITAGIERRTFEEAEAKRTIMILDVSPHRLGVATIKQVGQGQFIDDYFSEIIPKDSKLPAAQRREYITAFHGTQPISIRIFEAATDSNLCRDHRLVSELPLRNLNATTDGEPVQVEFRYTLDGTLDVSVRYISVPSIRVEGTFTVLGGNNGTAPARQISEKWREAEQAETCLPLLDQAERIEKENPDASPILRAAADAVKLALLQGDESEIRRHLDALTDLLFEMV